MSITAAESAGLALRETLRARLAEIDRDGLRRRRRSLDSPQGPVVIHEGRRLANFSSNDYLGLANHPAVVEALCRGAREYGAGSGAAHLVSGHSRAHQTLEEELAAFTGRERALLFSTGYMANLGVISALAGRGSRVFQDRLNHASLLDGARLAGAKLHRYTHGDPVALEAMAADSASAEPSLIVTDGVFSMDGDSAPLPDLAAVAAKSNAWLMVDDAHGLGVIGAEGRGTLEHFGLGQEDVPILMGTLGKALGTFGAFVAGCDELIEYLIQKARTYIYTTALPPGIAEATRTALGIVQSEPWRRERLPILIDRFRTGARVRGLKLADSATAIQPIILGGSDAVVRSGRALLDAGFLVGIIRPPTVPAGTARLRITLCAEHSDAQVDGLLDAIAGILPRVGEGVQQ